VLDAVCAETHSAPVTNSLLKRERVAASLRDRSCKAKCSRELDSDAQTATITQKAARLQRSEGRGSNEGRESTE